MWVGGNPALGQCYPTARVVQHFLPTTEIARGTVWTGSTEETHFWNVLQTGAHTLVLDLTWQQFPPGSVVTHHEILDRDALGDSPPTVERCQRLLAAVVHHLASRDAW